MRYTIGFLFSCALALGAWGPVGAETHPGAPPQPGPDAVQTGDAAGKGEEQAILELGITEGQPVDEGFVFLEGRYIEAPYRVDQRGGSLFINGVFLRKCAGWPLRWFKPVTEDPGVPNGLTRDSNMDDMRIPGNPPDSWDARKYRWLKANYTLDEARRLYIEYLQTLPFVKSVRPVASGLILVEHFNGKIFHTTDLIKVRTPPTKDQIVQSIEQSRRYLEKELAKGVCFFFFAKGPEISCGRDGAARNLGLMAEILRSERPKEEKATLLRRMGLLPPGDFRGLDQFLTNFQVSDQLDKRLAALAKDMRVKPRRLEDLPPLPPDPTPLGSPPAPGGAPPKGAP